MKRKIINAVAIVCACLAGVWIIGRVTGALRLYTFPSESNMPAIKPGSYMFSTNLKSPRRGDFAAFRHEDPLNGRGIWCHRVIGMPGDEIHIRDGVVSVNGALADRGRNLTSEYVVDGPDQLRVVEEFDDPFARPRGGDTASYLLPDQSVMDMGIRALKWVQPQGEADPYIQQQYGQAWNGDQFGPVRVPPGHYFLLGDNRHNALDSRYIGFVAEGDIVGTVIGRQ